MQEIFTVNRLKRLPRFFIFAVFAGCLGAVRAIMWGESQRSIHFYAATMFGFVFVLGLFVIIFDPKPPK